MANANNFVFLNGRVLIGDQPHHTLLRNLSDELGLDTRHLPGPAWGIGLSMQPGIKHYVARGHINNKHFPEIWESNTDVNSVRDAVEDAYRGLDKAASIDWQALPQEIEWN